MINEVKSYKPGDEGFEEIAKTITDPKYIRSDYLNRSKGIYGDIDPSAGKLTRRKENVNEQRKGKY